MLPTLGAVSSILILVKALARGDVLLSRCVVLQLFIMQRVLCADIRAPKLALRFSLAWEKDIFEAYR